MRMKKSKAGNYSFGDCPINMSRHKISLLTKNGQSNLANKESIRINNDAKKGTMAANSYNLYFTRQKMDDLQTPIKGNNKKGSSKRHVSIFTNTIDMVFYKYICQLSWWNFYGRFKS